MDGLILSTGLATVLAHLSLGGGLFEIVCSILRGLPIPH